MITVVGPLALTLAMPLSSAAAAQKNQEAMNVPINKRPPNQVGLATPAATSTRMGNTFGTSVKPQRPPN